MRDRKEIEKCIMKKFNKDHYATTDNERFEVYMEVLLDIRDLLINNKSND